MKLQIVLIFLAVVFLPVIALSQDETKPHSIKLEAGLGYGYAGQGDGTNGRMGISYVSYKWGVLARLTVQDGAKGEWKDGLYDKYQVTESFMDWAILGSRVMSKTNKKFQVIASAGIGSFIGDKLNDSGTNTIAIDKTVGLAYEIGIATSGHAVGVSSRLFGNINKEAVYLGVAFSIALDLRW